MSLSQFLNFNHTCPICDEPLHLYMQQVGSSCFEAKLIEPNLYEFNTFKVMKGYSGTIETTNNAAVPQEKMLLLDKGNSFEMKWENASAKAEAKKFQIYFFFLCNPAGFVDKVWGDYEINLYKGCYYRSTPFMEYQKKYANNEDVWTLETTNKDQADIINKDEAYSFKQKPATPEGLERVYMVNLDYEKKATTLWHYSTTESERKKENFKAKLFEKEMPLLGTRIKAGPEDREKLLERLDGWIMLS